MNKHPIVVVKPSNFYYGMGVHKANIAEYKGIREAFDSILAEGIEV